MKAMREKVFDVLSGQRPEAVPFVPDITDWYLAARTPTGHATPYPPGGFIPDDAPFHKQTGTIPKEFEDFTLMDFYRHFGWGFHAHIYDWLKVKYTNGFGRRIDESGNQKTVTLETPNGNLTRKEHLAQGSWAVYEHFVKEYEDLEIMAEFVESQQFEIETEKITGVLKGIGTHGQADIVVPRSPFAKLVHEYMGFEQVIYTMMDAPKILDEFLCLQEEKDIEVIKLAARGPQKIVIISDHADENLISPAQYQDYCIPFYKKAIEILHGQGKWVSTHLDGNINGYLELLPQTGFDILDGCTPWPMFNYTVEALSEAMPENMYAFCGVPSTMFCQDLDDEEINRFADKIVKALKMRVILNVGDILPPNGNIKQVIALGNYINSLNG